MQRIPRPLLILGAAGLAACIGDGNGPGADPVEPSPWIYEDDPDPAAPELDAAAVADAIEASLALVLQIDPNPVFSTFSSIMGERDGSCPFIYETVDGYANVTFWQDGCQASSGAMYEGYGYVYEYVDYAAGGDLMLDGVYILLSGALASADGAILEGAGAVSALEGTSGYYDYHQRQLEGTFIIDGRSVVVEGVPWLDGSIAPDFAVTALYVPELNPEQPTGLDGRQVSVSGAVSGGSVGVETVSFEDVSLTEASLGSSCDLEPHGTVSVRTDDGNWIDVVFDSPEEYQDPLADPADCDGCGRAWFRGEELSEVCVDFSALLDWETRPW